jgi:competence protein ComEC
MTYLWQILYGVTGIVLGFFAVSLLYPPRELRITFLDIGQGDSIVIETPFGNRILIDGGSSAYLLEALGKTRAWYRREFDLVIATHPDRDHIGGLIPLFEAYRIHRIMIAGVTPTTAHAERLETLIASHDIPVLYGRRGMRLVLDHHAGVMLDILFPDYDVSTAETNTASIVSLVSYGEFSLLLTGDAPRRVEEALVAADDGRMYTSILKLAHHGAQSSSSQKFLEALDSPLGIISAGRDNPYGHPHPAVTARFVESGGRLISTQDGTIVLTTTGEKISRIYQKSH